MSSTGLGLGGLRVMMGSLSGAVTGVLASFFVGVAAAYSPGLPLVWVALIVVGLRVGQDVYRRRDRRDRLVILGAGALARHIAEAATSPARRGHQVVGMFAARGDAASLTAAMIERYNVRPMAELTAALPGLRPRRIVVALTERRGHLPLQELLQAKAHGISIKEGLEFWERITGQVAIESVTPSSLIFSQEFQKSPLTQLASRAISLLASVLGLVLGAPLFLVTAIGVKLDSPGPVFFVQPRLGLGGRRFNLVKFRTMQVGGQVSEWAGDNQARITRLGYWLRKFRLDELPQFVNVLRGDMNLVGPRPHPVTNYRLFLDSIPYYVLRCSVRPGITGWAQVQYGYADSLAEETAKMRYDLYYVKYRSVILDLKILFATVRTVLFGNPYERVSNAKVLHAAPPAAPKLAVAVGD